MIPDVLIDAHQHVWDLERAAYPWLGPHLPLWNRTFELAEIAATLEANDVGATVLVQSADNDQDTDLMIAVADENPQVAGIVAYLPLDRPQVAHERLSVLRKDPRVVGVRVMIHRMPDPDWILRPEVDEGLTVLELAGVPLDYPAVLPRHLEHVPTLVERHPDLPIVIDHLGGPPIGEPQTEPWWTLIGAAAAAPGVHAKLSGLYPYSDPISWSVPQLQPFVDRALELFGPPRLMYGGDWPISIAAGGYGRVLSGLLETLSGLADTEREQVLAGTARRFYRLPDEACGQSDEACGH